MAAAGRAAHPRHVSQGGGVMAETRVKRTIRPGMEDPSWGPVGSLLQQRDPVEYERVLRQHVEMVAAERQRARGNASETNDASGETNETRVCLRCTVTFQPLRTNHRYCTNACRLAAFRERKAVA